MTEFKKLEAEIEEISQQVRDSSRLPVVDRLNLMRQCDSMLDGIAQNRLQKFVTKAAEPDLEKRLYGPAMVEKINALALRVRDLSSQIKMALEELEAEAAEVEKQRQMQMEDERLKAQQLKRQLEEEEARKAELLRREREEEQRRAAEAAQRAKEEAEEAKRQAEIAAQQQKQQADAAALAAKQAEEARIEEGKRKAEEEARAKAAVAAAKSTAQASAMTNTHSTQSVTSTTSTASGSGIKAASIKQEGPAVVSTASILGQLGLRFGAVNEIHDDSILAKILTNIKDAAIVIDFMAPWCRPCVMFAPTYAALAGQFSTVLFLKVDCEASPSVPITYSIRAFPTFHAYFRGKQLFAFSGASADRLSAAAQDAVNTVENALVEDAIAASMAADAEPLGATGVSATSSSTSTWEQMEAEMLMTALIVAAEGSVEGPMRASLERLRSACSPTEFTTALDTLEKFITNISNNPSEPKFRAINKGNAAFKDRFGRFGTPASNLLEIIGFRSTTRASTNDTWEFPGVDEASLQRLRSAKNAITIARIPPAVLPPVVHAAPVAEEEDELAAALRLSLQA